MKMMLWNVEGLRSALSFGAYDYFSGFDVVLLNETFQLELTSIKSFYCFEELAIKENAGRPAGGLLVAVKPYLNPKKLFSSRFCVAIETSHFAAIIFYFSPIVESLTLVEEVAERLCDMDLTEPCLVFGDFNARMDVPDNEKAMLLLDVMDDFGFSMLSNKHEHTYICHNGKSTIDLVCSNCPGTDVKLETTSDIMLYKKHIPICVQYQFKVITTSEISSRVGKRRLIGEIDPGVNLKVQQMIDGGALEDAYAELCDGILNAIPKNVVPKPRPKYSIDIERQKRKVRTLHHKVNINRTFTEEYNREKMRFKNMVIEFNRTKALEEEERRINEVEKRPWKLNPRRNGSIPCKITLEDWTTHFDALYNPALSNQLPSDLAKEHNYAVSESFEVNDVVLFEIDATDDLNKSFTVDECRRTLFSGSDRKAVGPDSIANEHLKGSFDCVGYLWVLLFNCILTTGDIINS